MEKSTEVLLKTKNRATIWPSNPTSGHIPWENCNSKRHMHPSVHHQSILKEINPEYSLEGLMLKLKLQNFGHLMWRADSLEKTLMFGEDWRQKEKRAAEEEMVRWDHWLKEHELEQIPGDNRGQGSRAWDSPWGPKELDTTQRLNHHPNAHCSTIYNSQIPETQSRSMESGFTINIIECESKLGTRGRINISAAENEVLLPSSTLDSLKKQVLTKSDVPLLPQEKKKKKTGKL